MRSLLHYLLIAFSVPLASMAPVQADTAQRGKLAALADGKADASMSLQAAIDAEHQILRVSCRAISTGKTASHRVGQERVL